MCLKLVKLEYRWKYNTDEDWPYNGMVNDLYRGIQAGENYLVALGLFAYSEAVGWEIRGARNNDKDNWACYQEFTENYVGYRNVLNLQNIFKDSRNGLAHRYFVKNRFGSILNDRGDRPCGIEATSTEVNIYINSYFRDFVKGLEKYLDKINGNR